MTAAPEPPATRPDCTAVVDDFGRRLQGLQLESLRTALLMLEFRLGTTAERPCDPERAQLLDQTIKQRLAAEKPEAGQHRRARAPAAY